MSPPFRLPLSIIVLLFSHSLLLAQAPDWSTVTSAGGTGNDRGTAVAVDASGNTYVAGYFYEEAFFGSLTITSSLYKELFVAKMASDGTWLWAVNAGSSNHSQVTSIALDDDGNAYVTGDYNGTGDFGGHAITSNAYSVDVFVAKINNNGVWQWAVSAGGPEIDKGYSIAIDNSGNSYVTGQFQDTANFGTTALTSNGDSDIFIAKLNAAGAWMGALGAGSSGFDQGFTLTVDASNNVYVSGSYSGNVTFGTIQLTSVGDIDTFVTKLDSFLSYIWASSASGGSVHDIVTDGLGNAYLSGGSEDQSTFGSITVLAHIFLAKINNSGAWIWADGPGGEYWGNAQALAIDSQSNIYVTGNYDGNIIFGSNTLTSDVNGQENMFVAKLSEDGEWDWAEDAESTWIIEGHSISVNHNQIVSITGRFYNTISLGSLTITSAGSSDIFCVSLTDTASFVAAFSADVTSGPAPFTVNFTNHSIGNPSSWSWDFQNDGTIDSEVQNPTFTYNDPGTYSIQLTISNGGNSDSQTMTDLIQVLPSIPVADFTANVLSGVSPLLVTFTDVSQGNPVTWEWDFQNDGNIDSYEQNPQYQYSESGSYSVSLTVSSAGGTDAVVKEGYITVTPSPIAFTVKLDGTGDYPSIQDAINGVSDASIIVVYPGTYLENIDFSGKDIVIESLFASTQDDIYINQTIIDGGHNSNTVTINDGEGLSTKLTGFTITNGFSPSSGGGILIYGSSPTISYCKIVGNEAVNFGGGFACLQNASPDLHHLEVIGNSANNGAGVNIYVSNPTFEYILIADNHAGLSGGGMLVSTCPDLALKNVTLSQNSAQFGGAIMVTSSQFSITNSILWANQPQEIYFNAYYDPNHADVSYCDIEGGQAGIVIQNGNVNMGSGNINSNPLLTNEFRLTQSSPCIDVGDPDSELDPDNSRTDMGAFYFDPNYVSIDREFNLVKTFVLEQNFPNPFNPTTTIRYGIPEAASVFLTLFDIRGNVVKTFASETKSAGWYEHTWNGLDESGQPVTTGLYLTRLQAGAYTKTIKMLYLK
ncbi:MAG: PKD domain-containing protein [Candidatus Marinimicrobia bacterium]|nr:PKD domain-containing protein [Candidatus Neomarinimicrobiota bacterium]